MTTAAPEKTVTVTPKPSRKSAKPSRAKVSREGCAWACWAAAVPA